MTTSPFNRLLKVAVALTALCVLAFSNPCVAGPELVKNGNFDSTAYYRFYPGLTATDWDEPYDNSFVAGDGAALTYCYSQSGGCGWGPGSAALSTWAMLGRKYSHPEGWASGPVISQLVTGLEIGRTYAVSFSSWGLGVINDASSNGGFWQVSLTDTQGRTQTQNGPMEIRPASLLTDNSNQGFWQRHTVHFTATDVIETLGFGQGAGPALTYPSCVPCHQYMYLDDISMTDVTTTLKVQEALGSAGRINGADQFKVSIVNASTAATLNSANTGGTGSAITGGLASITGDTTTTYKVTQEMLTGSNSKLAQYDAVLSCSNANSSGTQFPAGSIQVGQNLPLLKQGDDVTCTLTNTPKAPTLRLTKAMGAGGRIDNTDQFTVQILQRLTEVGSGTTTGSGSGISGGTTGWVSLVAGTSYNLAEVMVAGSPSKIGQYDGVVTCTNAWTGSATVVPTTPATPFTPTYGDALDCTITNTAKPVKLTLTQLIISPFPVNLLPPFRFNYSINNGWPVQPQALTTTTLNVPVSTAQQTLAARNAATTLSTSLPDARWFVSSFACTDSNAPGSGNATGNLVRVVASSVTIPAAKVRAGAALKCTLTMGHKVP